MYYLLINGQRTGPYDASDILRMLRQGAIGYETQVWTDGMLSWDTVGGQRHRFEYAQPPPAYQPVARQQPMQYYQQAPMIIQPVVVGLPKSRVSYILLGLFLGGLGIHNFYAGHSGRGATQLLLNLFLFWTIVVPFGVGIWVLIEVCTVDHDAWGNRMR